MAFLSFIFDPIFMPLLKLPPALAIALISFILTLLITLVYKRFTDQSLMKSLKEEIKEHQNEMKKHRQDPEKLLKIQKKAMDANLKYMSHSFKPTFITLIPILLIFSWLSAHFTYEPLIADTDFFVTAEFEGAEGQISLTAPADFSLESAANQTIANDKVEWKMKAPAGQYVLKYSYDNRDISQNIRINADRSDKLYEPPMLAKAQLTEFGLTKDTKLKSITIGNNRIRPFGALSIFGWRPGWLATYIITSIIFSIGIRKLLKVY